MTNQNKRSKRPNRVYFKESRRNADNYAEIRRGLSQGLLFIFILFLPTQFGKHFFFPFSYISGVRVDYLAPTIYLTDIIIGLLALINIKQVFGFIKQKKILLLLFFLFINVLFSQSLPVSICRYIKTIEVLIVGFIAYQIFLKEKLVLFAFLITGCFQLLLAVFQLITKHSVQGLFYFFGERYMNLSMPGIAKASLKGVELLRPYGTFSHPNSLAGFFLLLYIWILIDKRFNKFLILKYSSLFIFSLLIFISFSKLAIFSYLILNFYFLFFISRLPCQFCKWARFVIFGVVGLLFMQARTDPLTIQKRIGLLKNSFNIIFQHPITGVGIGNYLIAQNQYASKFSYFFNQPVHNIFLLTIAELGIPLAIYITYILYLLYRGSKKILPPLYLLLAPIFITGSFDHYWLTLQQNFLLIGFIIGISMKRRS